jgi:hypothetical protein
MEKAWYELSPIVYLIVSGFVMFSANNLAAFFALLLFLASLLIGVMRLQSRSKPVVSNKRGR